MHRIQWGRLHAEIPVGCSRGGIEFFCPDLIAAPGIDATEGRIAKTNERTSFARGGKAERNVELFL